MFEDDEYDSDNDPHLRTYHEKHQSKEKSDSEVEVFGVGSNSESDSDDQSKIALSDVEGQEDDIPDARAWGKEKKKYYGADYVDPDYGGFQGKDAFAAEVEQEEAKELQNQLMQQLDVGLLDIGATFMQPNEVLNKEKSEELLKTDLSKLTSKEKLFNLKKESPELFVLIDDFKAKLTLAKDYLVPIIEAVKTGQITNCKAVDFVQLYYHLILNYVTNIYMYLLLKCNGKLKNHPISRRLFQYRQLLSQVEPVFEEVIKQQISIFLDQKDLIDNIATSSDALKSKKKRTLKLLAQWESGVKNTTGYKPEQPMKRMKLEHDEGVTSTKKTVRFKDQELDSDTDEGDKEINREEVAEEVDELSKRAITYQIAKNKGLTPHRKKELRNPRVKHKLKFRKALIRRKGAVREPRKELSRYSGEISGIKTSVSKSIKIRS
ncbi:something about silencing protein 10 [Euwallacea fornicatus]|uniref:something about silencing protein 10 n=1 Tax=Euwallacea fornicatus TaxID=995702 RepID=UPI00338F1E5B